MSSERIVFLLVEDDHDHAVLVLRYIERTCGGNVVHRVKDGEEALAFLRREGNYRHAPRPDVILLDLKLPKYDGHEVLARIKADPELCAIPVIVLSTSAAELDRLKAYDLHADRYFVKPLNREEFSRMIADVGRGATGRRWAAGKDLAGAPDACADHPVGDHLSSGQQREQPSGGERFDGKRGGGERCGVEKTQFAESGVSGELPGCCEPVQDPGAKPGAKGKRDGGGPVQDASRPVHWPD